MKTERKANPHQTTQVLL